ncbi:MAG: acyl-CoA desaturase [Pseudomonadota bacterium]|nr:acyl-CoA desaturase [Pseudomonadota bacterium]
MILVEGSPRIVAGDECDPAAGTVKWRPIKSLWIGSMTAVALVAGPLTFSLQALAIFIVLCAITLCAGHSVGMHRRLIHNSFECPLWLEYIMVYLGVLVGMAGPFGMMRQHDLRDWAQRQTRCHDYLCHRKKFWHDAFWQLHCDIEMTRGPAFTPEPRLANDSVYAWMERYWMLQQAPLAAVLFALGGWGLVVWGVCVRISVCVTGHWLVGYFAHNAGPMRWRVDGASVQGRDVPIAALLSMGESWHNNHHAFPGSARIGLDDDQPDPGWWLILWLERLGLVWNIRTPQNMDRRPELIRLGTEGSGCPFCRWLRGRLSATS